MKKVKVGIILISVGWSGGERVIYDLVNHLDKSKLEVTLFLNKDIINHYRNLENIEIVELNELYKRGRIVRLFTLSKVRENLKKILKEKKMDILNLHMMGAIMSLYNMHKKLHSTEIITLHGTEIKTLLDGPKNLFGFADNIFLKQALKFCATITSVSNHQIQNLPEKYKSKTVVIPNGVDSEVFKTLNNIKQKKNVILFTGRFIDIKGIHEILAVAKQLPQYEFWFAGQGPLANLINLPNTKNLGFKTTEELVKLYSQATLCIFPSHREGLPLCGLEAMSCSRAVIATPLGFSEYIENGKDGIIIPAKNETALKNAILDLMTNGKKRKTLEKNARKKALKYSWDKIAKQYLKVFREVVKKNKKV